MISYLEGKIKNKGKNYLIILVNGIGYKVFVNNAVLEDVSIGEDKEIYIFQNVKEDALDLYGFKNMEELELFELLLSISGIGPKGALAVLSIASVSDIKNSISRGDSSLLVKVSGIGKKTAERVVLELRDKVGSLESGVEGFESGAGSAGSDEIDALMALGYSMNEAREALRKVAPEISDSGERIREALKKLG
jgi:Holliday junction DNA helicase RuvA